jgi:hypothetical protein
VTVKIKDVIPNFARRYPQVKVLGTLPRSPRLASLADEHDGYLSMLDIAPQAPFARALNQMADSLCKQIGIPMSLAMPKANPFRVFVAKLRGDKVNVPPANTSVGALQA